MNQKFNNIMTDLEIRVDLFNLKKELLSKALNHAIMQEAEKEEAEFIVKNCAHATLAPKLSLHELVSYISQMDLLIGNDTGPTHIAWAQNIPSITLFGPTTTRMMYETPRNKGIKSPSKVNLLKIDKNDFSIKDIKVEEIVKTAKELLADGI